MARLVGKKLDRKHSAVGSIIVSHSDPEGVARYSFLGIDTFDIDAESNYDDLVLNSELVASNYLHALVPYTSPETYNIPFGAIFSTSDGITFVGAENKSIQTCTTDWSTVTTSAETLRSFRASDGWNNYKYVIVPVVQGTQKTVTLGVSDGKAAQTFLVSSLDIEAADNYYTKQFCYVEVTSPDGEVTKWSEISHLQLATNTEKVFEIDILDDLTGTQIKFGDSINGAIPSQNSVITLHYLETLGADGNITELYKFQNEIDGAELPTNSGYKNLSVGCQNMWPIIGGKDLEKLAEYKVNAETAYAKNYQILHTYDELRNAINGISPIPLMKVKTSTYYETSQINSTKVVLNKIGITGLSTAMKPLNSIETVLFESIINATLNKKVLSNKSIKYCAPNIVEINSLLEIEPKTAIQSKEDYKENLEGYLTSHFGKSNLNPIDCYKQADLIRGALQCTDNIGSIQSTNMLTVFSKDVTYGLLGDSEEPYFVFKFEFPVLTTNVSSIEGFCDKALADGNEIPYVFNVNINGNATTFVVKETRNSENEKYLFEQSEYFPDSNFTYFFKNLSTEKTKYVLKQLALEKHTFSRSELQNADKLKMAATETFVTEKGTKGNYFFVTRSKNSPVFYLALNALEVVHCLGFKVNKLTIQDTGSKKDSSNIGRYYTNLLSSMDNDYTKISVSFEPVDKTVTSSWNTVMYYDNIDVVVEDSLGE